MKYSHLTLIVLLVLGIAVFNAAAQQPADLQKLDHLPAPTFDIPLENQTSSGSVKLVWNSSYDIDTTRVAQRIFELQESADSLFVTANTRYKGPDLASYISGLPDGTFYYRVREMRPSGYASEWSPVVRVQVEHHSLQLAYTLFGIGGTVFLLTVGVVLLGVRRTSREQQQKQG